MIRLRVEPEPPIYQLDVARRLIGSDDEAALALLKADPLRPVRLIEVGLNRSVRPVYSDWSDNPYTPIAMIPEQEERQVKVTYADDYRWNEERKPHVMHFKDGTTYVQHDPEADQYLGTFMDLGPDDPRYHKFTHVSYLHMIMLDMSDTVKHSVVVWRDLVTSKSYCAQAIAILST